MMNEDVRCRSMKMLKYEVGDDDFATDGGGVDDVAR